ncbi:MAG: hypothetical protein WD928_02040 [Gammaproteobacteria bacterium]
MTMKRQLQAGLALMGYVMTVAVTAAEPCPDGAAAQAAVERYLSAMQNHQFEAAYDTVTARMTDGKERGPWAALQKMFYEGGEVNIFGIDIRPAVATADDPECVDEALVPNVLQSRDKFNNQGITEFEVYTVVHNDGEWRVDRQETLFDQADVDRYFPGETLPELRDQY